jgi:hypothetical protein
MEFSLEKLEPASGDQLSSLSSRAPQNLSECPNAKTQIGDRGSK